MSNICLPLSHDRKINRRIRQSDTRGCNRISSSYCNTLWSNNLFSSMTAEIFNQTKDSVIIRWSDDSLGFGELTMKWNPKLNGFMLDTEMMGMDTVMSIMKALSDVQN